VVLDFLKPVAYAVVLVSMVSVGIATSLIYLTLFAFAGMLPPRCTQGLVSGLGLSGLVVTAFRLVTKAVFPNNDAGIKEKFVMGQMAQRSNQNQQQHTTPEPS